MAHARKIPGANDHIGATRKFNNPRCRGNIPVKVAKKQELHIGELGFAKRIVAEAPCHAGIPSSVELLDMQRQWPPATA